MRSGGKYIIEDGRPRKVEGTVDHPAGNRARPSPDSRTPDPLPWEELGVDQQPQPEPKEDNYGS